MKSTGVIRRIDELGRIVIPKEIRRSLHIRNGENLEILIEDNNIILKKVSKLEDIESLATKLCNLTDEVLNNELIITDREKVIASVSQELKGKKIDKFLIDLIDNRESYLSKDEITINLEDYKKTGYCSIVPIITSTDCLGLLITIKKTSFNEEHQINKLLAKILVNKVDI